MSGISNPIIFYPAAFVMILLALLSIKIKNIFYSLLSAIAVFFLAGIFFYILGSEYNAVVQIAIYGVAVPVILGLAVMFTNLKNDNTLERQASNLKYVMFLIGGLFVLASIYLVLTSLAINPDGFELSEQVGGTTVQTIKAFGQGIFVKYVWAFELVSLILTIVVVGLTLCKGELRCKK